MGDYLKRKTIENLVYFYAPELKLLQEGLVSSKIFTVSDRRTLIRNSVITNKGTFPRLNIITNTAQKILDKINENSGNE